MRRISRRLTALLLLLEAACGGGDTAPAAAPIASLSASALTVGPAGSAELTWTSSNATACTGSGGWSGAQAPSGSASTGALTKSTTYSLTCSGAGGVTSPVYVTVNVTPTVTLNGSAVSVAAGGTSVLTWNSSNATSCTASGAWNGAKPTSGSESTAALTVNATYALTCSGPGGSSSPASVAINVVPTATLAASPRAVATGNAATLTWSSTNASACTASGGWSGAQSPSGTTSTGPLSTTTSFKLTCAGPGGTSTVASVSVASGPVSMSPAVAALTAAQTQQFIATVPGGILTWSVDGIAGGSAMNGTISVSGLYTPGTAAGRHIIMAANGVNPALAATGVAAVTGLGGVYTYHNDLARDGLNAEEYALTTANVKAGSFGKLFSCAVDGAIYAQPLWIANLPISGSRHNVVLIATEHDGLFAFDADANPCVMLWSVSLLDALHGGGVGETPVPAGLTGYLVGQGGGDLMPEVGVTGTPVIDPGTNTLYVVSKSVSAGQATFFQRLHAIDATTGSERPGSPVTITGSFAGSGDGGSTVSFNSQTENQRAGLALVNGVVYIAWAAHEDTPPWYGWVLGYSYNGAALVPTAVFNVAPNSQQGGIWMSGGAPAADNIGNLYVVTGNGNFNANSSAPPNDEYGDSLLQLTPALGVSQYFTPSDQAADIAADADFGAGGAAVLADLPAGSPVPHLLLCGGKDDTLYLVNRDTLGGFGDAGAVQKISFGHPIFATGAYWNSYYYLGGHNGPLVSYLLDAAIPQMNLASSSSHVYRMGPTPTLSAAATQNGILWSLDNSQYCTHQSPGCGPAVLYAHDATNVATELWNSGMLTADAAGFAVKFTVPTVANGKVYVGTRGNNVGGSAESTSVPGELDVYGLEAN